MSDHSFKREDPLLPPKGTIQYGMAVLSETLRYTDKSMQVLRRILSLHNRDYYESLLPEDFRRMNNDHEKWKNSVTSQNQNVKEVVMFLANSQWGVNEDVAKLALDVISHSSSENLVLQAVLCIMKVYRQSADKAVLKVLHSAYHSVSEPIRDVVAHAIATVYLKLSKIELVDLTTLRRANNEDPVFMNQVKEYVSTTSDGEARDEE
jgi:hypothetical protein